MPEEKKISEYNSAFAQLYRLDNLWQQANSYSIQGNVKQWNWILDCIWRELAPDTQPKEKKTFEQLKKLYIKKVSNKSRLYQLLEKKEIFLRIIQNSQGKGAKYQDPDEDSMEE